MPHTQSRYQQDLGFTDARVFLGAGDLVGVGSVAAPVITRNAAGDWSLSRTAAGAETLNFAANLTNAIIRRTGFGEDLQEQFGGTGIPASAQPQVYRPDVIPAMAAAQQLQPRTALKLKGIKLLSFDTIFRVTIVALTTNTVRVDQTLFVNNVAPAVTAVLAPTGVATATQANPYVVNTALAAGQQVYRNLIDQSVWVELTTVMANTGKIDVYGFDCLVEFNFN
jgi:hypothetical protein